MEPLTSKESVYEHSPALETLPQIQARDAVDYAKHYTNPWAKCAMEDRHWLLAELAREVGTRSARVAEIDSLRQRVSGLEAARTAYANEFPLNAEGEPDVGSIHENIRKLKRAVHEPPAARESKFDLAHEIMRQLEAENMDTMQSCHFGYVLRVEREGRDHTKPKGRKCAADMHADPPQDCNAPYCGCNPAWSECIEMLQECGWKSPDEVRAASPPPAPLADLMPAMCHGGNLSNGTMLLTVWAPIDYPIVVGGNYLVSITPVTKSEAWPCPIGHVQDHPMCPHCAEIAQSRAADACMAKVRQHFAPACDCEGPQKIGPGYHAPYCATMAGTDFAKKHAPSDETAGRPFNAEEARAYGQFIEDAFEKPTGETSGGQS